MLGHRHSQLCGAAWRLAAILPLYARERGFANLHNLGYFSPDELEVEYVGKDLPLALPFGVLIENERVLEDQVEGHLVG